MQMKGLIALKGTETELKGVPEVIRLVPLGLVKSQKGDFKVDAESFASMKEQFARRGIDIVIDYEHQTLDDVQAPAAGWIKELILEEGAIAAKVEWTPKAQEYLRNKEYRYLSPVVLVRKSDGKATVLHSAALTNTPAIDGMFPIINSITLKDEGGLTNMELLKKLAKLLGLGEDATEEQVLQKLQGSLGELEQMKANGKQQKTDPGAGEVVANKVICGLLGIKEDSKTEDVAAAIVALKAQKPAGYVAEAEFKALKDKLEKRDAEEAVMKALKAGKLSAAQREWATEYALKDPKGFAAFVEKAPVTVPVGKLAIEDGTDGKKEEVLDETTLKICKSMGVSEEDLKKYGGKDVR